MRELQQQVQDVLDELVASGAERGVQVAVYHRGEQVVDAVAGVADPATGRPVDAGTVFYNYSIGKGATSTLAHLLAERGLFGYDTPVAELWPEFAAHGKQAVTVRQVLSHTAGVPAIPPDTTPEDLCDWDRMCAAIAESELWWEPGTKVGYHAYSFGYIVGELVRRATGTPISRVLATEVAGPLGVDGELWFGMPAGEQHRLARLEDAPGTAEMAASMPPDLPMFKAAPPATFPSAELGNRPDILAADIPAGAKTSARAIARMYAALLGEVGGVRLLTPERLGEVGAVASSGIDQVYGNPSTWALGYGLGLPDGSGGDPPTAFGMAGAGGSFAFADPATGVAFGLTKNRLGMDFDTVNRVVRLVTAALS
jgi:CubicO group peptidase (beta-lactamase class C family)